jgi:hypothetical protein
MRGSVFLFLIFLSLTGNAQFNDSVFNYVRFSTTGILNNTNDKKSFVLTNALAYTLEKNKISLSSSHNYVYGKQGGDVINNDYTTSLNMDILKNTHKIYYWGLMNYTTSKSLNIFNQFQGGVGLGWNVVNNDRINIVITDGIMYETSQILNTDKMREHYNTWRNSLRIKHAWNITQDLSLEGSHFWQPSLEDGHDYIIRSSAALNFQLKRWLRFTTGLTYNKISRTDRENLILNIGLTAAGYF